MPAVAGTSTAASSAVFDLLRDLGYGSQIEGQTDEREFTRNLVERARAAEQFQQDPYLQAFRQHAPQFQEWLRSQAEAKKQAAETQKKKLWDPPLSKDAYRRAMSEYVVRNPETGEVGWRKDTPLSVIQDVERHRQYVGEWSDRLVNDPEAALAPFVQAMIASQVQPYVQQQVASVREMLQAQQIVAQLGGSYFEPDGRPNKHGQMYSQIVTWLDQKGIKDLQTQDQIAREMTEARLGKLQGEVESPHAGGSQGARQVVQDPLKQQLRRQNTRTERRPAVDQRRTVFDEHGNLRDLTTVLTEDLASVPEDSFIFGNN